MADDRKPMANIPPFGLRMQPELKARIEASARENERSMNAEIVARLEGSFEDIEGYKELTELFLETMKLNAENARRELEEYRHMLSTIRILRYAVTEFMKICGDRAPEHLQLLVGMMNSKRDVEIDVIAAIDELNEAIERRDAIVAEQEKSGLEESISERSRRLKERMAALQERLGGDQSDT